jgi:alkylmercury lyase
MSVQPLTIGSLQDAVCDGPAARVGALPPEVRELHRRVLRAFLTTGRAPHRDDLCPAAAGGVDLDDAFRRLAGVDLVHLGHDGQVLVAYPFSGRPTGHTVRLGEGPTVKAMCAIDALGIPYMTGRDALIVSTDPDSGQSIRVERRAEAWRWSPVGAAVLLAQRTGDGPAVDCLCPLITFHGAHEDAARYLDARPDLAGVVLDQTEAVEIARRSFGAQLTGVAPGEETA